MSDSVPSAEQLEHLIEVAFNEVKYPGDDELVYDRSGYHLECNQVVDAFKGRHWRDLPLDFLRYQTSALSFMTPEAYRFYLPAYLMAAIMHYDEADIIPESVVYGLTVPSDPGLLDWYRQRTEGFTTAQLKALRAFLEFMKRNHGEDDPLGDFDKALASLQKGEGSDRR